MSKKGSKSTACAEHGVWTDVPAPPLATQQPLTFSSIDANGNEQIVSSGKMTFAMVGCSGDPSDGTNTKAVATAIATAGDSSFLYHLGDLIYTEKGSDATTDGSEDGDTRVLWNSQFYAPYTGYAKQIVSVAGNHDGKSTPIIDYLGSFCSDASQWPAPWAGNLIDHRPAMIQPYVYWRFDTPSAYFIGLYSNIANGGMLDNPSEYPVFTQGPQYRWLVAELKDVAAANNQNSLKKAVLLTVHYPPYSGAANFDVRGDPSQGPGPKVSEAPYLASALQQAFIETGQRPDVIFSAHAHLFQRITYTFKDGSVMPCLVVGCGGHSPLEMLSLLCDGETSARPEKGSPVVIPGSFAFPEGDSAQLEYYDDGQSENSQFGYLKVTVETGMLRGQFLGVASQAPLDQFTLDLTHHRYL